MTPTSRAWESAAPGPWSSPLRHLCTVILLLAAGLGRAEPAAPSAPAAPAEVSLSVSLGLPHLQVREELLRPLRWAGTGGALALGWQLEQEAGAHRAWLGLPVALVTNRYAHEGVALALRAGYGYVHQVAQLGGGSVSLGGQVQGQLALQYYLDWDEEHLYWLTTYDVGPTAAYALPLGDGRLTAQVSAPLLALVSRPPLHRDNKIDNLTSPGFLLGRPHQGLRVATLPEHLAVTGELAYTHALSQSWQLRLSYLLQLRTLREPRPVTLLGNDVQLGVLHAF